MIVYFQEPETVSLCGKTITEGSCRMKGLDSVFFPIRHRKKDSTVCKAALGDCCSNLCMADSACCS